MVKGKPTTSSKGKKAPPPDPLAEKRPKKTSKDPIFEANKRSFRLGGDILPKRDLSRYVKWPHYIKLQRQRRILLARLKVPPALNQFNNTCSKEMAGRVLALFNKYKPETHAERRQRMQREAQQQAEGGDVTMGSRKPYLIKFGLNHITDLVENKIAKLVVIAHDVDPIELVVWLPALCRRKDVPYCIIKGKSRLGQLVHQKTAAAVALSEVRKEDTAAMEQLRNECRIMFNDNTKVQREGSKGSRGVKSQHIQDRRERLAKQEEEKKLKTRI
ncbi:unnamed protein product [Vitrella brassicaformis CCMP3155]|uniref:60S ribosomal protein L7a n=2 Tax=Vitrella brassicaformis TaxID=1169539 RepID=A0A0G4GZM9_VITBC|nr:unnamed protein product [Vitrella brassicaformis CCMP3155]|eukprot:CEM36621.1 unnamed protein product [Vitrella brassicaformis CCMP3155]